MTEQIKTSTTEKIKSLQDSKTEILDKIEKMYDEVNSLDDQIHDLENAQKDKLYVIVDSSLAPIYACVQGGHAVAQYLIDNHRKSSDDYWQNETVVYLSYPHINLLSNGLTYDGIPFSEFHEPDLDNKLTAIAVRKKDLEKSVQRTQDIAMMKTIRIPNNGLWHRIKKAFKTIFG